MAFPRIILTVFLFFQGFCLSASENLYFEQLFASINKNIEEGVYEQNLEALPQFVQENEFQTLSCYQKGRIFHKIGVSYYLLNREEEAIQCFRDSVLAIWQNCTEVPNIERATTIYNMGICNHYLGNVEEAKKLLDEALVIFENDPDYPPFDLAKKFQGIGSFYLDNYDSFRAKLYYENALNIFREMEGTEWRRFDILNNFLIMSIDYKRYEQAKGYFKEALALSRETQEPIDDYYLSFLYQNAGIAHFELGELDEALEKSLSGLNLIDSSEYPILYSNALEKIALINGEKGQFSEAIAGLNEVVRLRSQHLTNPESHQHLAYAFENLYDIYQKQGDLERAGAFLQKAFEILVTSGTYDEDGIPIVNQSLAIDDLDLVRLLSLKANLFRKKYENTRNPVFLEKPMTVYAKMDTLINQQLLSLQFHESKLKFLSLIQGYYGEAIQTALSTYQIVGDEKYLHLAYFFSSKTKAVILQLELNEANAFQSVASLEMIEKEKRLVQQIFDIQAQISEDETSKDSLLRSYIEAQRELDAFLLRIEKEEPEYFRNKYAFITPPGIETIQAKLPKDLAVVEYFYQTDTIYSFWITRDHFVQIPISNDEKLEQAIQSFVDQCHDPGGSLSNEIGHFLYQNLVSQGLQQVKKGIARLCIIPDGKLHTLPFEALNNIAPDGNKMLIEEYSVAYSYSIDLLFREKEKSFDIPYLGFGTQYSPKLSQKLKSRRLLFGEENLSQLALAQKEINSGTEIFYGKSFLNKNATLDNFYEYSTKARVIHLSLHGLVDFEDPMRSSILFDDHQKDFMLFASDLYSHKINADLVVLSACHSANGKIYLGEGVQGMSKVFILSGAKSILSSLWSASEVSSLEIMTSFLQHIKNGKSNDVALRQAKLDYLTNARPSQKHPFFWANFVIIGELNSDETQNSLSGKTYVAIFLIAGLFFFLWLYLARRRKNSMSSSTIPKISKEAVS